MEELIRTFRSFDERTREILARQLRAELECGCLEAYDERGQYDAEASRQYVRLNDALAGALEEGAS